MMGFADDKALRDALHRAFSKEQIGKLPRVTCRACSKGNCQEHMKKKCATCGAWISPQHIHLDFVGHAVVTDRLNQEAPDWTYTIDRVIEDGAHVRAILGTMTIGGKSLPETGDGEPTEYSTYADEMKKAISDFLRRAAMRFGVALDLWSKQGLETSPGGGDDDGKTATATVGSGRPAPVADAKGGASEPKAARGRGQAEDASPDAPSQAPIGKVLLARLKHALGGEGKALEAAKTAFGLTSLEDLTQGEAEQLIESAKLAGAAK